MVIFYSHFYQNKKLAEGEGLLPLVPDVGHVSI